MKKLFIVFLIFFNPTIYANQMEECLDAECVTYFKEFRQYAKRGYADAMYALGDMYWVGYGTKKDPSSAIKTYRRAAKFGSSLAQFKLGYIYLTDKENFDYDESLKYFKKAARNGSGQSSFILGVIYYRGQLGEKSLSDADKWLTKAYEQNNKQVREFIEHIYLKGEVNADNLPDVYEIITNLAKETEANSEQQVVAKKSNGAIQNKTSDSIETQQAPNSKAKRKSTFRWPEDDGTEVITVRAPSLIEIFDYEIQRFSHISPEKYRVNTGSKIFSQTCERNLTCTGMSISQYQILAGELNDIALSTIMGGGG